MDYLGLKELIILQIPTAVSRVIEIRGYYVLFDSEVAQI